MGPPESYTMSLDLGAKPLLLCCCWNMLVAVDFLDIRVMWFLVGTHFEGVLMKRATGRSRLKESLICFLSKTRGCEEEEEVEKSKNCFFKS